ncbi:MAG: thioredoxin family protein [Anaerolineae bacterium]
MAKPVVDGIERNLEDEAQVLRLSVTDSVGRVLAIRYRVRSVPTLVLLDGDGEVVLRQTGTLHREPVMKAVQELLH